MSPTRKRIAERTYESITSEQEPPWANLAFGAAGVAYALWRDPDAPGAQSLAAASALLRSAADAPMDDYWSPSFAVPADVQSSLHFGPLGVHATRALVAHARNDSAEYERALTDFFGSAHARSCNDEVLQGVAGILDGARILFSHTRDPRAARLAISLASELDDRAREDSAGWLGSQCGFGHGVMGILHALVSWSSVSGDALPPATSRALARVAEASVSGEQFPTSRRATWCSGAAGAILLWTKAFETIGEEQYRELALASAKPLLEDETSNGNLCCGYGGRAYALLALDRIDPGAGWHARASVLAKRAVLAMRQECCWPHGLLKGTPGLRCLLRDLARPPAERFGFPFVEG